MRSLKRKQLHKLPETVIANISAVPQWFKFVVPYTDIQVAATTKTITLCTLPIKAWIHAVAWKTTVSFSQNGDWNPGLDTDPITLLTSLGDEDVTAKWLNAKEVLSVASGGGETATNIEDAIGLTPYEPDFDNTHALKAQFGVDAFQTGDLSDLDAGEFTVWFLLSSMNAGAAG